jgi:hypothetical protein
MHTYIADGQQTNGDSSTFTFLARMRTERIARLCRGWDWPLMSFIAVLAKTIRDRVRGERSCKSKRWIHADIFVIKPTIGSTDFRPRYRAYPVRRPRLLTSRRSLSVLQLHVRAARRNSPRELRVSGETGVDQGRALAMALPPAIHVEGFELWDAPSAVTNFTDRDAIRSRYYAEAAELAKYVTGANHAHIFDHQVRQREAGRPTLTFGRHGEGSRPGAAGRIRNDYTETSGQKRFEILPLDEKVRATAQRFAIVNIWRSIGGKVVDTPLARGVVRTSSMPIASTRSRKAGPYDVSRSRSK